MVKREQFLGQQPLYLYGLWFLWNANPNANGNAYANSHTDPDSVLAAIGELDGVPDEHSERRYFDVYGDSC